MNFDRLAPLYRWMEVLLAGDKLHQCRTAYLAQIPSPQNILTLGEGHGRGLAECCRLFPGAHITCVDSSLGMIAQARRHLKRLGLDSANVEFIHADVLAWSPPAGTYDLIITHFFLDCFTEDQLAILVPVLARAATPDACWLLADFQVARSGWRRLRSRIILWLMYRFFRTATQLSAGKLTPPDRYLLQAGFVPNRRRESEWGLLRSEWWTNKSAPLTPS